MGEIVLWVFLPGLLMIGTSVCYFVADRNGGALNRRLVTSAHGFIAAVISAVGVACAIHFAPQPQPNVAGAFFLLYLIPLVLVAVSLIWYRGPKAMHLLQVLNVPATLCTASIILVGLGVQTF